jgi:uncharacterized protein YegL
MSRAMLTGCEARADIIFLLDSSGSVGHADFRSVKEFVHRMVGDLQIGKDKTRVGLVTYSSQSRYSIISITRQSRDRHVYLNMVYQ